VLNSRADHSPFSIGPCLEDIALQVVYNENRITKLELKIINESLLECKKANADIYQDAKIMQIENSVMKMSEASKMVKIILNQIRRVLLS
jgi:uncharacterized protein with PhoU and TrkA domain